MVWNTSANRTVKAKFRIGNQYGEWIGEQEAEVWPTKLTGTGVGKNVYVVRRDDVIGDKTRFKQPDAISNCIAKGYRLPNRYELMAIYANKASYGTFSGTGDISSRYWSSTAEYGSAFYVSFNSGNENTNLVDYQYNVRCVKDMP